MDPLGESMGIFLVISTAVVSIPQIAKLLARKSSEGVQPATLCMITLYASANVASTLATKSNQITQCSDVGSCVVLQLDLMQILVGALVWLVLVLLTVMLPPHNTRQWKFAVAVLYAVVLIGWGVTAVVSFMHPCEGASPTLDIAAASAWISAFMAVVAFIPQLYETCRMKSAGSLSLIFTLIQAIGCYLVAGKQVLVDHDTWTVFMPTAVSGTMQLAVFTTAIYFSAKDRCARRATVAHQSETFFGVSSEQFLRSSAAEAFEDARHVQAPSSREPKFSRS